MIAGKEGVACGRTQKQKISCVKNMFRVFTREKRKDILNLDSKEPKKQKCVVFLKPESPSFHY